MILSEIVSFVKTEILTVLFSSIAPGPGSWVFNEYVLNQSVE